MNKINKRIGIFFSISKWYMRVDKWHIKIMLVILLCLIFGDGRYGKIDHSSNMKGTELTFPNNA